MSGFHYSRTRLEVKLPTIWTHGKAEVRRIGEQKGRRKKIREEKESEERRSRHATRKKSRQTLCVFQCFCGPGGLTSRLAEAAGAEPFGQMRDPENPKAALF